MISAAQVADAAKILGIAVPLVIEALRAIKCAVEDCDVVMLPADAPDLMKAAQENRNRLARKATETDRASIDAELARPIPMAASIHRGDSDEVLTPRAVPIHAARPGGPPCGARRKGEIVLSTLTDENVTCDECIAWLVYEDG